MVWEPSGMNLALNAEDKNFPEAFGGLGMVRNLRREPPIRDSCKG
jgi:hypothetical protein